MADTAHYQTDEKLEWQDVADFRSEYIGNLEHRDTVRKGSKLLYEYIDAGWVNEPNDSNIDVNNEELIVSLNNKQYIVKDGKDIKKLESKIEKVYDEN